MTDYLSNQASRFLHQYAASPTLSAHPFFLSLTYTAPHIPLQALRSDYDSEEVAALGGDKTAKVYAAMIRALDRGVGKVLQGLADTYQLDNTLVIFTRSDNGDAHYLGLSQVNAPYRGWEATFFEGGIHVPLFFLWPA